MYIPRTNSTNTLMRELIAAGNPPEFIYTGFQTAGRGQAGNGWESEEGKNLLCSIAVESRKTASLKVESPFYLNVLVSVAVHKVVAQLLQRSGLTAKRSYSDSGLTAKRSYSEAVTIKWPNDIYWGDRKIAGILVENTLMGSEVRYSIAGIGLNVNQTEFVSGAPNPVSMKQISGTDFEVNRIMEQLIAEVRRVEAMEREEVWAYYKAHLYRREGFWPFVEREVSLEPTMNARREEAQSIKDQGQGVKVFMARIADICPTGEIVLEDQNGISKKYHFKEIRFVV